jgi:transcriptional regulator with XRE-family HTH domain
MVTNTQIGNIVAQMRQARGFSAAEVASLLDMDPSSYSRREHGKSAWQFSHVARLCEILSFDLRAITGELPLHMADLKSPHRQRYHQLHQFFAENPHLVISIEKLIESLPSLSQDELIDSLICTIDTFRIDAIHGQFCREPASQT